MKKTKIVIEGKLYEIPEYLAIKIYKASLKPDMNCERDDLLSEVKLNHQSIGNVTVYNY